VDTIEKGQNAERLLNDPVLKEAFTRAGEVFIREWMEGTTTEAREAAHAKQAALAEVEREMRVMVSDAIAEVELRKRQKPSTS
jgi:hypothetical protein